MFFSIPHFLVRDKVMKMMVIYHVVLMCHYYQQQLPLLLLLQRQKTNLDASMDMKDKMLMVDNKPM
jgi:hypothetical protein